jgi:hypothetical protein
MANLGEGNWVRILGSQMLERPAVIERFRFLYKVNKCTAYSSVSDPDLLSPDPHRAF